MKQRLSAVALLGILLTACATAGSGDGNGTTTLGAEAESERETTTTTVADMDDDVRSELEGTGPGDDEDLDVTDSTVITTGQVEPSPPPPSEVIAAGLQAQIDAATADLATRLGVAGGDITVLSAEPVVWPDGSLGCPDPERSYTQVQVEGYRIVLWAKGTSYPYHGGGSSDPFLCAAG